MALRDLIDRTLSEVRLRANLRTFGDRRGRDRSGLCTFAICVPLTATGLSV